MLHSNDYSWSGPGTYTISLTELDFNAGTSNGVVDACLGDTVDLFSGISGYDLQYGNWIDLPNTSQVINGSDFATTVLASQVYDFEYRVQLGCSYDSIVGQVEIYPPSSAGDNGQITVCKNEPINLYYGLTGTVDLGGTWYDPQDNAVSSNLPSSGNIPGQFNYDYVAGNGVCPDDTALVLVIVDGTCDWTNVEEVQIGGITVFPNPTSDNLNIVSNGEHEDLAIVLVDMNGKVVYNSDKALVSGNQVTVDITGLTTGVYMLQLSNDNASNTYRIVVE